MGISQSLEGSPIVQVIIQVGISTHLGVLSEQFLIADENSLFIKGTFTIAPVAL
jgi:hypothetical protein